MTRDQRYNASKKGKRRTKRAESSEYRKGYRAGYKAGKRAAAVEDPIVPVRDLIAPSP